MSFDRCKKYRAALIEFAKIATQDSPKPAALGSHLTRYVACTRFLDTQLALSSGLRALAAETALEPALAGLETGARLSLSFAGRSTREFRRWQALWRFARSSLPPSSSGLRRRRLRSGRLSKFFTLRLLRPRSARRLCGWKCLPRR